MKALVLISGGIDSIVAAYLMQKKGLSLTFIHINNRPLADINTLPKTKKLIKILAKKFKKNYKLFIVPNGENLIKILEKCDKKYTCVLCRRLMYRIAEKIAKKEKCKYIITGENLSQVASQTLPNLIAENQAIKIIILRPLLCYNKEEIIKIAKKIGTFETSIEPGSCCKAVPKHPVTKANLNITKREETKISINKLISNALKNTKVEIIKNV